MNKKQNEQRRCRIIRKPIKKTKNIIHKRFLKPLVSSLNNFQNIFKYLLQTYKAKKFNINNSYFQQIVSSDDYPFDQINDYSQIPFVPYINLNLNKSPFHQFSSIQKQYQDIGAAVLRANWKMPNCFKFVQKPITTRLQSLQHLIKGQVYLTGSFNLKFKNFQQKIEAYSVKSFRQMALKFQDNYKFRTIDDNPDCRIEKEYWNLLTNPDCIIKLINPTKSLVKHPNVQVEYAADLPSKKYGSAFPTFKFQCKSVDYSHHPFNLNCINKQPESPFQIIKNKREEISGVTQPWVFEQIT